MIWSDSIEEHEEYIRLILEILREIGICASKKKSILFVDEIYFLDHIIFFHDIESDQGKIDKILASRISHFISDIKEFNELINYVDRFISRLSEWSIILFNLIKKNVFFKWEFIHEKAFQNIKWFIKNHFIYKSIDHDNLFSITLIADASNRGLRDYINQEEDFKMIISTEFHSRAFNSAEKNYSIHDKEMIAIVDCLKTFESQLIEIKFDILIDHIFLTY